MLICTKYIVFQALSGDIKLVSIPGLSPLTVRNKQRSYETIMMLLPKPQVWGNKIIIETPKKNYTSADYEILFEKSNFRYGYERYQLIKNLTEDLIPPGVNTIHMFGTDIDTALYYQYESDVDFDSEPKTINGNGDGKYKYLYKGPNHLFTSLMEDHLIHTV